MRVSQEWEWSTGKELPNTFYEGSLSSKLVVYTSDCWNRDDDWNLVQKRLVLCEEATVTVRGAVVCTLSNEKGEAKTRSIFEGVPCWLRWSNPSERRVQMPLNFRGLDQVAISRSRCSLAISHSRSKIQLANAVGARTSGLHGPALSLQGRREQVEQSTPDGFVLLANHGDQKGWVVLPKANEAHFHGDALAYACGSGTRVALPISNARHFRCGTVINLQAEGYLWRPDNSEVTEVIDPRPSSAVLCRNYSYRKGSKVFFLAKARKPFVDGIVASYKEGTNAHVLRVASAQGGEEEMRVDLNDFNHCEQACASAEAFYAERGAYLDYVVGEHAVGVEQSKRAQERRETHNKTSSAHRLLYTLSSHSTSKMPSRAERSTPRSR